MTAMTLAAANSIISEAFSEAARRGARPLAMAVLTAEGSVISLQRQDGASMFRTDVATGKAWGAVAMGQSTRKLAEKARENPSFVQGLAAVSGGRILASPGGVLVTDAAGRVLGSAGISGDSGPNDEAIAIHGIEAAGFVAAHEV